MTAGGGGRDRDSSGRPRSARPRDALGRPLSHGEPGREQVAGDLALPPEQALHLAQRLLDQGRPFHAHEVLEASWKSSPDHERDLWRGLAQIAVGVTHALRGNAPGAAAVLRRGAGNVRGYAGRRPHGLDPAAIADQAETIAALVERDGLARTAARGLPVDLFRAAGPRL